jgi:hypothetical protein
LYRRYSEAEKGAAAGAALEAAAAAGGGTSHVTFQSKHIALTTAGIVHVTNLTPGSNHSDTRE